MYTGVNTLIQVLNHVFLMFRSPSEWIFFKLFSYTSSSGKRQRERAGSHDLPRFPWSPVPIGWHQISAPHFWAHWNHQPEESEVFRAFLHSQAASSPSQIVAAAHIRSCTLISWTGPKDYWREQASNQQLQWNPPRLCTTQNKLKKSAVIHLLDINFPMPRKANKSR